MGTAHHSDMWVTRAHIRWGKRSASVNAAGRIHTAAGDVHRRETELALVVNHTESAFKMG